jgi:hypothetical protein
MNLNPMEIIKDAPRGKIIDVYHFVEGVKAHEAGRQLNITQYNLNPEHQRNVLHNDLWKSNIIKSLFTFKDIPAVYFHETTDDEYPGNVYESLDGKQRCSAIYEYCTDQFNFKVDASKKSTLPDEMHSMHGKFFSELTPKQQNYINAFEMVFKIYHCRFNVEQIEEFFRLHQEQKSTTTGEYLNSSCLPLRTQLQPLTSSEWMNNIFDTNNRLEKLTGIAYISYMYSCRFDNTYIDLLPAQIKIWWGRTQIFSDDDLRSIEGQVISISHFMDCINMNQKQRKVRGNYLAISWFIQKCSERVISKFIDKHQHMGFNFPVFDDLTGKGQYTNKKYEYMLETFENDFK